MSALLFLLFYIASSTRLNTTNGLGIYHGKNILWTDAPYIASIRKNNEVSEHCCGATIISLEPPVLVTAAHCVDDADIFNRACGQSVEIGCDTHECANDIHVEYKIAEDGVFIHPNFTHNILNQSPPLNDIALVKLDRVINEPVGVKNITVGSGDPCCENSHPLSVYGYGRGRNSLIYGQLKNGTEEYMRNSLCNAMTDTDYYTDESIICYMDQYADDKDIVTVCGGDNGGPVISHRDGTVDLGTLVGVISWEWTNYGIVECNETAPQTAANVGFMYDWITTELENL